MIATYCGNYLHYSKLGTSACPWPYILWLAYITYGFCKHIFIDSLDYSFTVDKLYFHALQAATKQYCATSLNKFTWDYGTEVEIMVGHWLIIS